MMEVASKAKAFIYQPKVSVPSYLFIKNFVFRNDITCSRLIGIYNSGKSTSTLVPYTSFCRETSGMSKSFTTLQTFINHSWSCFLSNCSRKYASCSFRRLFDCLITLEMMSVNCLNSLVDVLPRLYISSSL